MSDDLRKAVARANEEMGPYAEFDLSETEKVRWTPMGMDLLSRQGEDDFRWRHVVCAAVEPVSRLVVDGVTFFEYSREGRTEILKVDELLKRLKSEGCIFYQARASDVLSAVSRGMATDVKEAHATFGVYSNAQGFLEICDSPVPIKDEQKRTWETIAPHLTAEVEPNDLRHYLEILGFWHPYEVVPSLGAGLAAPFTPVLRKNSILFPHVYNWAPEHDLGKSLVALTASLKLWGMDSTSGPAINSNYRLASQLDSSCLPVAVEEADKLKNELWPTLKDSAERWLADKRGSKDLTVADYRSRAVLILTGNVMPITQGPVLKRFLIPRFDSSARRNRRKRSRELGELWGRLRPVGYCLLRWFLEEYPRESDLMNMVNTWRQVLAEQTNSWSSAKRPEAWACVYLGLKVLEVGCRRLQLDWRAPSIATFFSEVVEPVEGSTSDLKRTAVIEFSSWFEYWLATHTRIVREEGCSSQVAAGEEDLFRRDGLTVADESIEGFWVTLPILQRFNEESDESVRIATLKELALQGAELLGLPHSSVLDSDGKHVKTVRIGRTVKKAAFVPNSNYVERQSAGNQVTLEMPEGCYQAPRDAGNVVTDVTSVTKGSETVVTGKPDTSKKSDVTTLPQNSANACKTEEG